jgi:tRNA pseudouridine38-40 synthase
MKKACKFLYGNHDYTSFAKLHSENYTNNCEVYIANWKEDETSLVFTIKANRFLRNMVRAIVGTLIEVGEGKISFSDIETILLFKDRAKAGYSVPANGLSLIDIEYPKDILI